MKKLTLLLMTLTMFACLIAQEAVLPLGSGTLSDPYQISSWQNLYWMSVRDSAYDAKLSSHYIQTTNIDFPEEITTWNDSLGWNNFGYGTLTESHSFIGKYDGQNHIIKNLYINRPLEDMVGFFGVTDSASICNLGLDSVNVTAGWGAAGIVGEMDNSTIVSNCFVKGNITGDSFVSGITGYSFASNINNCYFIGTLVGNEAIGAIAGYNDAASIENCYAAATATTGDYVGILVGCNDASTVTNCFWDTDLANNIDGIGDNSEGTATDVLGKTTLEMKTESTYTQFGWDFDNVWDINDEANNSYPSFTWETTVTAITDVDLPALKKAVLRNVYPNPFNPSTTISFDLPKDNYVSLIIYNIRGQKVKTLTNSFFKSGNHSVVWNGKDNQNNDSPCGVYFFKLQSDDAIQVKKALLLK